MIPPRNLDTRHLFEAPATRKEWDERATELRERILLATGLLPMPSKCPLQARTTSTFEQDGIVVENVAIQTLPGFWLCGNVYRPAGSGPFPAIANPHGHWTHGRKEREADVREADPAPAAPAPGKADLVSLAVNLARQGFLVFAYDMVGYNETDQVKHRHFGIDVESWAWGVSELGLQTWNSIRAVDYLCERRDVDASRIGATGASGGGTQVFLLAAIDERIQASAPVNMVSAIMQGGCICENGPGLRVGTDNAEIAALFAPKPQLLVSCTGDWTRNLPKEEGPAVRRVYALHDASSKLQWVQFNYQHNYNLPSREAVTAFFRRWLSMARPEAEKSSTISPERLGVQRPAGIDEAGVHRWLRDEGAAATVRLRERGGAKGRETLRTALRQALAVEVPVTRRRSEPSRMVLVVSVSGDPRAGRIRDTIAARAGKSVRALELPAIAFDRNAAWKDFFSTYNRTAAGDRVAEVVAAASAAGTGIDIVGLGDAGAWCLLARAIAPKVLGGLAVCDMAELPIDDDRAVVDRLYAPGIRRAGDVATAAWLAAEGRVALFRVGDRAAWDRVRLPASVRLETGAWSPEGIADFIADR